MHTLHSRAAWLMQHLPLLPVCSSGFESKHKSPDALTFCVALESSRVAGLGAKGAQYLAGLTP